MFLLTSAAPCRGIDVVRYNCWCRMMMWTTSALDICQVLATALGTFHEWLPRRKHRSNLESNGLKKKTRAPSCRNQHETQILQKTLLKSKKQKIKKFMKTTGNTSVFCRTQGNYDAKSCCDQWKTWQNPGILNIWCMSKCQKRWFYWRDFPPAGMIDDWWLMIADWWYSMIQYDTVWYSMIQNDTVWYSMIQYDTVW